jgi:hypothetical protein
VGDVKGEVSGGEKREATEVGRNWRIFSKTLIVGYFCTKLCCCDGSGKGRRGVVFNMVECYARLGSRYDVS